MSEKKDSNLEDVKDKIRYGGLNPIDDPPNSRYMMGGDATSTSNTLQVAEASRRILYESEVSLDGEFRGIVLPSSNEDYPFDPSYENNPIAGALDTALGVFGLDWGGNMYYVRVPELHANIPLPDNLTDKEVSKVSGLHDLFLNESEDSVAPWDLVMVSFYDNNGLWNPKIIRYIDSFDQIKNGRASEAKSEYNKSKSKNLNNASSFNAEQYAQNNKSTKAASERIVKGKTEVILEQGTPYKENRVRRDVFGNLPINDSMNMEVIGGTSETEKLHRLVALRFKSMRNAALSEGLDLRVQSGNRRHRWRDYDHYISYLKSEYGSIQEGKRTVAFASPHETGLAIDIASARKGTPYLHYSLADNAFSDESRYGLYPDSTYRVQQKQSPEFKWLVKNAHKYGFTPYKYEPWHWECQIPVEAWKTGNEFTDDFNVYVTERLVQNKDITTRNENFWDYYEKNANA